MSRKNSWTSTSPTAASRSCCQHLGAHHFATKELQRWRCRSGVSPCIGRENGRVDLISDALPFGGLWYTKPDDAVDYATFFSRSQDAVIRVYDDAGNVIE